MDIARKKVGGVEVVAISGRVSGAETPGLTAEFQAIRTAASSDRPSRVVLDVTALDNLPSAAVGSLVEAIRALEAVGGRLVLAAPNRAISVVLDRLGIGQLLTSYESADAAVGALSAPDATQGP